MLLFGVSASVFSPFIILYELKVAGLAGKQWAIIFVIYKVLRYALASICAELRNSLEKRFSGVSRNCFKNAMIDAAAISIFQSPLYTVSALTAGASVYQIAIILAAHLARNALVGWLYGAILDWTRARFNASLKKAGSAV